MQLFGTIMLNTKVYTVAVRCAFVILEIACHA